ncbi:MAG: DNA-binding protein WhiA [Acholeplasmataceae bacterium]|nr:DNA-binding protein WhiA [Acholeplasmataceae bacterium]
MTFARSVKEELTRLNSEEDQKLAELSALLHINSEIVIKNKQPYLDFQSNNLAIIRRFFSLVKDLYESEMEIISKRDENLKKKNHVVIVKTKVEKIINEHSLIIENIGDYELITQTNLQKQAYLRGAFLASGSINNPIKPSYHLEIYVKSKIEAIFIQRLMNYFNLNAKLQTRRKGLIIYLKEAEAIVEFLKVINAYEAVFKFEDLRIQRDFSSNINRLINIEIANEKKIIETSNQQLKQINFLKKHSNINLLDQKTQEIIELREENKSASLLELATAYEIKTGERISKSGINHRFKKLEKIYLELKKGIIEKGEL